jgi:hypothetical protein
MAKKKKSRLRKAKTKAQACAIGFSKARKAGRASLGGAACGKEMKLRRQGKKSPRKLILPRKRKGR